jgi:hypothetical protein
MILNSGYFSSGGPGAKTKKNLKGLLLEAFNLLKGKYFGKFSHLYKLSIYTTDESFDVYGLMTETEESFPYTTVFPVFDANTPFYLLMNGSGELVIVDQLFEKGSIEEKSETIFTDIDSFEKFVNLKYGSWFEDKTKALTYYGSK